MLAAVNQLGLLLLLFITGVEIRRVFHREERKTVGAVFLTGMIIPFVAGIGILQVVNLHRMWGPNGNTRSFLLVFAIAMAVTSIPVISRIMHDLGILDTTFARVVLGVAVLEDLVLYVVLAVAIGYAGAQAGSLFGLPAELNIAGGSNADMAYHVLATLAFLAVSLVIGPPLYRWIGGLQDQPDPAREPDRSPAHLHAPSHDRRPRPRHRGLLRSAGGGHRGGLHRAASRPRQRRR